MRVEGESRGQHPAETQTAIVLYKSSTCKALRTYHPLKLKKKKKQFLFIYYLFQLQCFHLWAPEANSGVLIGCFPPGLFQCSGKCQSASLWGSEPFRWPMAPHRMTAILHPAPCSQPQRWFKANSTAKSCTWHFRGLRFLFTIFLFPIGLKGTPPNYDYCLLCLSASQASVRGKAQGKTCQALIHFFH